MDLPQKMEDENMESNQMPTMRFEEFVKQAQEKFKSLQDEKKEVVKEETAVKAFAILKNISYLTAADFYIGSACVNTLNTYVKQDDSKIGYSFKSELLNLISCLYQHPQPGVLIDKQSDKHMTLLVIQFYGQVQFSFHGVQVSPEWEEIARKENAEFGTIQWDGVRKQRCAETVFQSAMDAIPYSTNQWILGSGFQTDIDKMQKWFDRSY